MIVFVFFKGLSQRKRSLKLKWFLFRNFWTFIRLHFSPFLPLSFQNISRVFRHRVLDLIMISEWLLLDRKTASIVTFEAWEWVHPHSRTLSFCSVCYHSRPSADIMTLGKPKRPLRLSFILDLRVPQALFSVPSCPLEIIAYALVPVLYTFQPLFQTLTVWD